MIESNKYFQEKESMKELEDKIVRFAEDRDWLQFNTPENLAKSISIE